MEYINKKENFLFNEETRFIELMIEAELDEDEDYEVIKTHLLESLVDAYQHARFEDFNDYELLAKEITISGRNTKLKLGLELVDAKTPNELSSMTFSEFIGHLVFQLCSTYSIDGEKIVNATQMKNYPLTIEGLLQAVKDFYVEAKLNEMI